MSFCVFGLELLFLFLQWCWRQGTRSEKRRPRRQKRPSSGVHILFGLGRSVKTAAFPPRAQRPVVKSRDHGICSLQTQRRVREQTIHSRVRISTDESFPKCFFRLETNPNGANMHLIADLYAEVVGVLVQSRFHSVRQRFMTELKELRGKETGIHTTQSVQALLMGMKFFRVKVRRLSIF